MPTSAIHVVAGSEDRAVMTDPDFEYIPSRINGTVYEVKVEPPIAPTRPDER